MCIQESVNTKFLGLQIDNHLNWTNHIDKLIPKVSGPCYGVRSMLHVSNTDALKSNNHIFYKKTQSNATFLFIRNLL
jgi:hypothetical protein